MSTLTLTPNPILTPGHVYEVRILNTRQGTVSGYYDDVEQLARDARKHDGTVPAIYTTLNPVSPALLARAHNRLVSYARTTTGDADILTRDYLLIDCDAVRPAGISSTEVEHQAAIERATLIATWLTGLGWPYPVVADSGNGAHLLYRIDLPNDAASTSTVKAILDMLALRFDDEGVVVDKAVFNAARITKLYGSMACKGDSTTERPHRRSAILKIPDPIETVPATLLLALAAQLPREPRVSRSKTSQGPGLDLRSFITRHALTVTKEKPWNGATAFELDACPFNPEHTRSSVLIQFPSGALAFSCLHNSCHGQDWQMLRARLEPDRGREVSVDTVSALSVHDLGEWPDPKPIKTELLPVEPLPLGIIPSPFLAWIKDVSERMQCPPDYVATAMIVMTSSVIGAGCGIRPKQKDDWTVIPNLWGAVVGRPSSMKTPAIGEAMKPMDVLTVKAKQEYDEMIKGHLADQEVFKARKEAIVGDMKSAAKGKDAAPSMDCLKDDFANLEEPKPPVWRRYVTNDATIEKMAELQATNPRGLELFRDELVGLFATWDKDGHEADRTFYMESWNGDRPFTSDRIGRGTTHVANLCVSLFGGIQPAKLTTYLHHAMRGLNNDGLVQRLQVLVYPDELPTWTLIDRPVNAVARQAAFDSVERLSTMDFRQYGAFAEEGQTPYFRFSDEAQGVFNDWLTELEAKLRTDEEPVLQEHFGKYRSLMPSLALQFHVLNLVGTPGMPPGQVSKECAEQAAAWCEYLESHARRIYGLVTNVTAQAAMQLSKKLTKGELPDPLTVRDVYRKEWSLLGTEQDARNACEELVSLGWLREQVTPPAQGQKRKVEYFLNPKVRR